MSIKERVKEIFDRYNVNLSVEETQLASAKLESGQEIMTDGESFAIGAAVFVQNDEGERIPLPDGTYTLEDGTTIEVKEGVIAEGEAPEAEPETPEEGMGGHDKKKEDMEADTEPKEAAEAPVATLSRDDVASMIKEAMQPVVEALQLSSQKVEELSKQAAVDPLPRVTPAPKKLERVDMSKMNLTQRVEAIQKQYANHG